VGLHRQILDGAQGLHTGWKLSRFLPTETCFPAAIDRRFIQHLSAEPRLLPQDILDTIRLCAIIEQVENDVGVSEFSARTWCRGSGRHPWVAFPSPPDTPRE